MCYGLAPIAGVRPKCIVATRCVKKGGAKVHSVIFADEGVPCDVQFTSAATNDSFMLAPSHYNHNEMLALDRA